MFLKDMFYRLFRIPEKPNTWYLEQGGPRRSTIRTGDAATLPMRTYTIEPEPATIMPTLTDDTTIIPIVSDRTDRVVHELTGAVNDVDFSRRAATALKLGNAQDVLAGLLRYVSLHPEPVTA